MNNSTHGISYLVDLVRRDSGINNYKESVEQVSLFLLLRLVKERTISENDCHLAFEDLFLNDDYLNVEKFNSDFSMIKMAFIRLNNIRDTRCLSQCIVKNENLSILFDSIPLRIRSEKILRKLINEIDCTELNEELAKSYDDLISQMALESASSGEFYSPKAIASTIAKVVNVKPGETIYDPAMGTGRFFVQCHDLFLKNNSLEDAKSIRFKGGDISPFAFLVCTVNLLLNGIDVDELSLEDSLSEKNREIFDVIISAIPFGKSSNDYHSNSDTYAKRLENSFIELTMRKLSPYGRAALIVPEIVLMSRSDEYRKLRKLLLTDFNLHTILSLPSGALSPYTNVKTSIIFFNNEQPSDDIFFYELSTVRPLSRGNQLTGEDFDDFVFGYINRHESKKSLLVSKRDIIDTNDCDLSINLDTKKIKKELDIAGEINAINDYRIKYERVYSELTALLSERKETVYGETVTIDDLISVKAGKPLTKEVIQEEGKFPVYGGNGIMGYYNEYLFDGENILIGRVGAHCGNVHYVKGPAWVTNNSFRAILRCDNRVHTPYLAHVLRRLDLNKFARGSAQPSISFSKIKDIKINLPDFEQQVELSLWFDALEASSQQLASDLEKHVKTFQELVDVSITEKCVII
ncbi:type I restriction enzyme M protein [Vibrio crassostreae]|uniref:N-6 DNA methylase n=1 Tax=Vibrio crassostreae TaxID=246167 RepID=UPI000F49961C|nr:N-6 DNA methylase [Vibrio crassostreae]ROR15977.1 type I restriction enzyme M protein [Vibrio crassostreae]CAK2073568.1 type I restriction enzyme M protein [Vibrio crassostreae]CAK2343712.1 type I restriction enzyme M protein [Vibrio crassostreae]CAK2356061.1 type I restriction enzyme M protein [Vibrio crassostreae]CAK3414291.1 type I restriction enzyme M protein [Vibrio crassostreae]